MVRELVGLHGGTIDVDERARRRARRSPSRSRCGSAHLPADQVAPRPAPDAPACPRRAEPFVAEALRWLPGAPRRRAAGGRRPVAAAAGAAGRVLVADDNADMREYLPRLLAPALRRRRSCATAPAALDGGPAPIRPTSWSAT